jgi:hypothetical protein
MRLRKSRLIKGQEEFHGISLKGREFRTAVHD